MSKKKVSNKKEKPKKEKQLDLGLRNSPSNAYYKYKGKYDIWLAGMDTKKFLKDPLAWFALLMSATLIGTEVYTINDAIQLPSEIPVFNYFIDYSKRLIGQDWIYLMPAIGAVVLFLTIPIASSYYHKERLLSRTLLLVALLSNISLCLLFFKLVNNF